MLSTKSILFVLLGVFTAAFCGVWAMDMTRRNKWRWPSAFHNLVGFATNFLDTLGIGSYATTTSLFRVRQTVADEDIPGTLTVGHTIPTITEAFIYITIVEVEMKTLVHSPEWQFNRRSVRTIRRTQAPAVRPMPSLPGS